jgi:hypothetical protein
LPRLGPNEANRSEIGDFARGKRLLLARWRARNVRPRLWHADQGAIAGLARILYPGQMHTANWRDPRPGLMLRVERLVGFGRRLRRPTRTRGQENLRGENAGE